MIQITRKIQSEGGDSSPFNQVGLQQRDRLYFDVLHPVGTTRDEILGHTAAPQPRNPHPNSTQCVRPRSHL